MALSFEESMKKANSKPITLMSTRVMSLSNDTSTSDEIFELNENYKWYSNCYFDEQMSYVDDAKNITVNQNQHCVTQENNSQCIPFEMNRYYDGVDLNDMSFTIHYLNSENNDGVAIPVNFYYSDSKIRFGWLLDDSVTYINGDVIFEIVASGFNEKDEPYLWRTRPNGKINVLKSLIGNGSISPTQDWYVQFITEFDEKLNSKLDKVNGSFDSIHSYYAGSEEDGDNSSITTLDAYGLFVSNNNIDSRLSVDNFSISNGSTETRSRLTLNSLEFQYQSGEYSDEGDDGYRPGNFGKIDGLAYAENDTSAVPYGQMMTIVNKLIARIEALESQYLIKFTVDDESYVALSGMTWQDFIDSIYNPSYICDYCNEIEHKFTINTNYPNLVQIHSDNCNHGTFRICINDGNDTEVRLTDEIIAYESYFSADQ